MNAEKQSPLPAPNELHATDQPVRHISNETPKKLEEGTALCLSGGGYRAMLFHIGVLWRLNEVGILAKLNRVSSVSGGSITAGVLAMNWQHLTFNQNGVAEMFVPQVVDPLRAMARESIDLTSVLAGIGLPFTSISDRVIKAYRKHLFAKTTLKDLPDEPIFVINATNLESGVLMRFSKPYLADYRVGRINHLDLPLAVAVAASSAFPPFLSPCTVDLHHEKWITDPGNDLAEDDFRDEIQLSDGGVYDNLGLETAWKRYSTILVSDAGSHLGADPTPPTDWARHTLRVLNVIDNQIRSLRKRQVIDSFNNGSRSGMYIGIRSSVHDYPASSPIPVDLDLTRKLAAIPTRLDEMDDDLQERLINWGYAICDTGLRSHVIPGEQPGRLPYPKRPLDREQP
ncbi:patatin-like phospholipase family protein [Nitrosomonas communis]|uniref:patatin-like phospholipase family protein n=1 Tax=Nitrosomonas communis TaxID=44574 RepID=UPI003D2D2528